MMNLSPHLQSEQDRLLHCIDTIRQSGAVAPALYYLSVTQTTTNGKTYCYARLVREPSPGKQDVTALGREGSARHRDWQRRMIRRDAIAELEQQLKLLHDLIERQQMRAHLTICDFLEPEDAD
jgi:hypothetical protein